VVGLFGGAIAVLAGYWALHVAWRRRGEYNDRGGFGETPSPDAHDRFGGPMMRVFKEEDDEPSRPDPGV
jgi:hypothetical protein